MSVGGFRVGEIEIRQTEPKSEPYYNHKTHTPVTTLAVVVVVQMIIVPASFPHVTTDS